MSLYLSEPARLIAGFPAGLPSGILPSVLVWVVVNVVAAAVLSLAMRRRTTLRLHGKRVVATVVAIHRKKRVLSPSRLAYVYITTACSTDVQTGQRSTFTDRRRRRPAYRIGDAVVVLVDPVHHKRYQFAE